MEMPTVTRGAERLRAFAATALTLCTLTALQGQQQNPPAAPPPASLPILDNVKVTDVARLPATADRPVQAGIRDIIVLTVANLKDLANRSRCIGTDGTAVAGCRAQTISLYLDGREIKGLLPESIDPSKNVLQFHLERGTVSDEAWADLLGAPPLDHSWDAWDDWFPAAQRTPTTPYPGAHYATFGPSVIRPFIEAMCPMQVCRECGEPRRRIVGEAEYVSLRGASELTMTTGERKDSGVNQFVGTDGSNGSGWQRQAPTLGWTDCGHNAWRNGIVLDPFCGSGTTLEVATGCGRDATGIDLDERNLDLIRQRVGLFLGDVT
jgi:hypothetical protein